MSNSISLSQYINTDLIALKQDINSAKKLLEQMAGLLCKPLDNCTEKTIYQHLLEREKLGNTGIGKGVALPHSRCTHTEQAVIAIMTLQSPVDYHSLDKQSVDIVFGLLVPEQANEQHLKILSSIAQAMSNDDNRTKLLDAQNPEQVVKLISSW